MAKIVIRFDCSKIVKKIAEKSCQGRMLSTEVTGNSVDVPGQPRHEICGGLAAMLADIPAVFA